MARLQGEDKPTYILSYPRWVGLGRIGAVILLVGVALARWVLAWISFVQPLIEAANTSANRLDVLVAQPLRPLISAHLSLLLVAGAVAFLYGFLPDLSLTSEGLAVRTILGWKSIPWTAVSVVRIMTSETRHRRLVLVQGTWTRWSPWPRLVSICLGAGTDPGVLVTSDIRDFKPLMRRMYEEVKQASPDALFDDEFLSPSALMVLEPVSTLDSLVDDARGEGWPVAISAQAMSAVPAGLILVQLLVLLLRGGAWWKPLAILGLCEMEWIIGALYLFALAEFFPGKLEFQGGLLLYPLAQIPRALLTVPMAMLVATGVPFLAAMVGLVGVLWAVMLTALLVQRLYRLDSILPAMAGGALQALLQFLALAVVFS
jgi:hypothetical protein